MRQLGQSYCGHGVAWRPSERNHGWGPFCWGIVPDKTSANYLKTLNLDAPLRKDMMPLWRAIITAHCAGPFKTALCSLLLSQDRPLLWPGMFSGLNGPSGTRCFFHSVSE